MAAPTVAFHVEGVRRLQERIAVTQAGTQKVMTKVNREVAKDVVVPAAKQESPKRTGTLAGSIRAAGRQTKSGVYAGTKAVPYAGVIHFGWPKHGISPNPFLYRAVDQRRAEVLKRYDKAVADLIRTNL